MRMCEDVCDMCCGLRGHKRIKYLMAKEFEAEYDRAVMESERLSSLFKDVCWYNFETACRDWRDPWPCSWGESHIELHGYCIEIEQRSGRNREIGHFPVYYSGAVQDAPPLPPAIILSELKLALEYVEKCRQDTDAPHSWAPGGDNYNKLLEHTCVPSDSARRRAKAQQALDLISNRIVASCDGDQIG